MSDLNKCIERLIERAAETPDPDSAMRLTQAALNAANALHTLEEIREMRAPD